MVVFCLREGLDQPRPLQQVKAWLADGQLQDNLPPSGPLGLDVGHWDIGVTELQDLLSALAEAGYGLERLHSDAPQTRVAAAALGLAWQPADTRASAGSSADAADGNALRIHQGTLRSGDLLEAAGSVLVLGDVNPGARVMAGGHVLVWGTLRGVAHAGCRGEQDARIVALQLRPLQLRIADAVARGPEDLPVVGVAEQAELIDGVIAIKPAVAQWPLA